MCLTLTLTLTLTLPLPLPLTPTLTLTLMSILPLTLTLILILTANPITLTLRRSTLRRRAGASGQGPCETQARDVARLGRGGQGGDEFRAGLERSGGGGCGRVVAAWPGAA